MSNELKNCPYRPELFNTGGVYRIQVGEYFYIGSSSRVGSRLSCCILDLKAGTHRSAKLQAAWDAVGEATLTILQEVRPKEWCESDTGKERRQLLEHEEIQKWFGSEFCCNLSKSAYHNTKASDVLKEMWTDPTFRENQIHRLKTRKIGDSARAKMSEAKKGFRNVKSRPCEMIFEGATLRFETGSAAAEHFGVKQQVMDLWLRGSVPWPGTGRRSRYPHLVGLTGNYILTK